MRASDAACRAGRTGVIAAARLPFPSVRDRPAPLPLFISYTDVALQLDMGAARA
jgi:hypothetical protein